MLYEYSPWADNTKTISLLDRVACLFVIILQENIHRDIINTYNFNNTISYCEVHVLIIVTSRVMQFKSFKP